MSQSSEDLNQELLFLRTANYVQCSLLCLVVYEYVMTFNQEIGVVWRRKLTVTSLLLLGTRWLMILGPILTTMPTKGQTLWVYCTLLWNLLTGHCICRKVRSKLHPDWVSVPWYHSPYLILIFCVVFSTLRVYALWQESRMKYIFPIIIFMLGIVSVGTNIFGWVHTKWRSGTFQRSGLPVSHPPVSRLSSTQMLFLTRSSVIAADVFVLVLTWIKSFKHFREMRQLRLGLSISAVLLRDGTIYLTGLLVISILQLLTYSASSLTVGTYASSFVQFIPPLLTQRFMLNLRQLNPTTQASENNSEAQHFSRFSMSFRTPSDFLGNIGEPLDHDQVGQMEEGADNGSCEAENPRDRLEEGFTRQASSSFACRDEPAGAAAAPVLFTERASEEDNIGSSTFSREIVPGPSTAADYQYAVVP